MFSLTTNVRVYTSTSESKFERYPRRYPVNSFSFLTNRAVLMVSYAYRGGLVKMKELFYFFEILDAATFRQQLVKLVPDIKNVIDAQKDRKTVKDHKKAKKPGLVKMVAVNIAFSHKGFVKVRKIS